MFGRKLIGFLFWGLIIFAGFTYAQDKSVDKLMNNEQTKEQVMDYIISHHNIMQQFMSKIMNNNDAQDSMMNYMMSNKNLRWNMMDHMFSRADNDNDFYNEMDQYMNDHGHMMDMMRRMMGNHNNDMKHHMMHDSTGNMHKSH